MKQDLKGNNNFLWYAKRNELIGLTSFFQDELTYSSSAVAGEKSCKVVFISNESFLSLLKENPSIKRAVHLLLCDRIRFIEMRRGQDMKKRIIEMLLFLSAKQRNGELAKQKRSLTIYHTKKELAEMIDTSLSHIRATLKELKNKGIVNYGRGWLLINNIDELQMLK